MALGLGARRHVRRARTGNGRPGAGALVVGNLLILAFLASVALFAGECWLRFGFEGTDTFGLLRTSDRWYGEHWHRNSDSFRDDRDYELGAVPEGRRRVTFLGDSFTTAQGVPDVSRRFANLVRAERPEWDVHVFAMNGWETGQHADMLASHVPAFTEGRYETDLVVLVYCLNDICDLDPEFEPHGQRISDARERGLLTRSSHVFDWLRFLWLVSTIEDVRAYFPRLAGLYEGDVWATQRARLAALPPAAHELGADLAVVTFPMLHRLEGAYPFDPVHATLDDHWRRAGIPHLDLLPTFRGRDADDLVVGALDAHPNEHAHALAAEAILPFLDDLLSRR